MMLDGRKSVAGDGNDELRRSHAETAIDEAKHSRNNTRVGAVITQGQVVLATGHTGERSGLHAEQVALLKAEENSIDVRGAKLYTTLEPCADSRTSRVPCSELIANAGITEVHIGEYDRNPRVYRLGWRYLRDHGVALRDFPADLRELAQDASNNFTQLFTDGTGMSAGAKFDFTQNGGRFNVHADEQPGSPTWGTRWSNCGARAIYFNGGHPGFVAEARYAKDFSEIDDPDALDYGGHCVRLDIGSIGVLRNEHGHVLCRVEDISPTHDYGGDGHPSVKIKWEIRLRPES